MLSMVGDGGQLRMTMVALIETVAGCQWSMLVDVSDGWLPAIYLRDYLR